MVSFFLNPDEGSWESREANQDWKYGLWYQDRNVSENCKAVWKPRSKGRLKGPTNLDCIWASIYIFSKAFQGLEMGFHLPSWVLLLAPPWRPEPQKFITRDAILLDLWLIFKISWLWWWVHGCIHMPKLNKLCTLYMCRLLLKCQLYLSKAFYF